MSWSLSCPLIRKRSAGVCETYQDDAFRQVLSGLWLAAVKLTGFYSSDRRSAYDAVEYPPRRLSNDCKKAGRLNSIICKLPLARTHRTQSFPQFRPRCIGLIAFQLTSLVPTAPYAKQKSGYFSRCRWVLTPRHIVVLLQPLKSPSQVILRGLRALSEPAGAML